MPEEHKGYFLDMVIGDFDFDNRVELLVLAYKEENSKIFYIQPIWLPKNTLSTFLKPNSNGNPSKSAIGLGDIPSKQAKCSLTLVL